MGVKAHIDRFSCSATQAEEEIYEDNMEKKKKIRTLLKLFPLVIVKANPVSDDPEDSTTFINWQSPTDS